MMAATLPLLCSKAQKRAAPPPNFDRLARAYRWMEYLSFGPLLSQCRTEFLAELAGCRKALVIGDGDGRFTARLLEAHPAIHVDAIDASASMLRTLEHRARNVSERLRTEAADAREWQPATGENYDLIVTHFFLDCLTTDEIRSLAIRIRGASTANAFWIVSDFAVPLSLFGKLVARPLVAWLYLVFGILTGLKIRSLPNHASALAEAGFRAVSRRNRMFGLLASELWSNDEWRDNALRN